MPQTRDESPDNLAARWCWQVARRDEARVARRLYRTPGVEGVYRLDAGAVREDGFPCLQACGVMAWLEQRRGAAMDRVMGPCVPSVWRDGLKPLCGLERSHALPALWWRDEALMRLGGARPRRSARGSAHGGGASARGSGLPVRVVRRPWPTTWGRAPCATWTPGATG